MQNTNRQLKEKHYKLCDFYNFKVDMQGDLGHVLLRRLFRHYNKDERMVPLMERIAWELAERVTPVINIRTIFHDTPEVVRIII